MMMASSVRMPAAAGIAVMDSPTASVGSPTTKRLPALLSRDVEPVLADDGRTCDCSSRVGFNDSRVSRTWSWGLSTGMEVVL